MRTNFNVDVESSFLGDKYHAEGNVELANVLKELSKEETSGKFEDLLKAGLLIHGELLMTSPKIQKEFFSKHKAFFEVKNVQFSKAKSYGKNGTQYDLVSKTKEK